mmetsp:Transcript_16600/g.22899  ORF Transcript_16600/g.22899 Transcript_16600/m.22899 type:complete len:113 (-) Transcript_16600:198-536(-)|eukprot:CAMPEP_0196587352 /NCGR_PEP_ID=MMETSP1081-20130531/57222_1 /TAXON_ID=36882 /ORGANISM="Pyramimonas amylifera, Strain CCMP720" /LENGTH=112 /DNA_ID=CAMNT_0041909523 /DNA_START=133 /DNA_END=471 /DNA_ORIENTATION=+
MANSQEIEFSNVDVPTDNQVKETPKIENFMSRSWIRICAGWEYFEEHLADFFGLNDSKYQWAVDEYFREHEERERRRQQLLARRAAHLEQEDGVVASMEGGKENTLPTTNSE